MLPWVVALLEFIRERSTLSVNINRSGRLNPARHTNLGAMQWLKKSKRRTQPRSKLADSRCLSKFKSM